ncbi:hypothetical protein GK047_00185 [Paenibacillus sp. SYP-B3998]|uniref:Tetratricopeptide repeat protein n=1 Tax=Paenibacillus sp. SYP-B3998 TaxID=2678564 RepID=A0A6G3ZS74_9BACL|nr:DUF6483 family protein [Paenibacillus sp. SYP-B3998]NEW04441.1 hypothetical protein [Paenibacillus sp. SYP-B3998]
MFRRDYFMRQIEQMTVTLHRILFNKEHIPISDARQMLDEASRHLLGLNVKSLQALSSKDILELLTYQGNTDTAKAMVIGDLFIGQGDMYRQHEQSGPAYHSYLKSLDLLLLLASTPPADDPDVREELQPRINHSLVRLQQWDLPADMKLRLFAYYEHWGDFAKAEDVLFHYMEDHAEYKTEARNKGILFYERLIEKNEDLLVAGNFSKEEAEDGLRFLKEKQQ